MIESSCGVNSQTLQFQFEDIVFYGSTATKGFKFTLFSGKYSIRVNILLNSDSGFAELSLCKIFILLLKTNHLFITLQDSSFAQLLVV